MTDAFNEENWTKFKEAAHGLKSSAGYSGAGLIHYDCYYIQFHYMNKELDIMMNMYNTLIEDSIEFILYCFLF